jgi:hypothetical protein
VVVFSKAGFDRNDVQKRIQSNGVLGPHAIIERPDGDDDIVVERLMIRKETNLMQ